MISEKEIFKKIKEILVEECEVDGEKIEMHSRLQEELEMDSLALLTLAVALENHFKLSLEENPENPPRSISEIIELIQTRLQEKAVS